MQATVSVPAAPAAPAPPAPVTITFTDVDGTTQNLPVPISLQEVAALKAQRKELSDQLTSAASRRHRLSEEIKSSPDGASRLGLEQRLSVLDKRIVQLESDIASTGRQLSAAPQALVGATEVPVGNGDIPENVLALSITFIVFVLFPMAFTVSRWIWKRTSRPSSSVAQLSPQIEQRMERLEQGVDAIAIEIERVTEGQRFVTKLLSEQHNREKLPASPVS